MSVKSRSFAAAAVMASEFTRARHAASTGPEAWAQLFLWLSLLSIWEVMHLTQPASYCSTYEKN